MKILDVDNTLLSGTIPELPGSIEQLYLYDTLLSGTLPASTRQMGKLKSLLFYNTRISGNLTHIQHLSSVATLMFYGTNIEGTLPETLGSMVSLTKILGYSTALSGTIPAALFHVPALQFVGLQQTKLSGSLPDPSGATELQELNVCDTHITGTLPAALGQLAHLQRVYLQNLQLDGAVPDLSNCTELDTLSLTNTTLKVFPRGLPANLTHLFLDNNPIKATTASLCAHEFPNLEQIAVSFVNVPILLGYLDDHHRGAWVTPPCCIPGHSCVACNDNSSVSCVVGKSCSWLFEMRDVSDQPVRTGGIIADLRIGYDCDTPILASCTRSGLMVDNRNGTYTATVPAEGWIDAAGVKMFRFFNGSEEFRPMMRGDNVKSKYDSLRTVVYAPRVIKCESDEYDTRKAGVVLCTEGLWTREWQDSAYNETVLDSNRVCAPCQTLCSTCTDGVATLKDGWRLNSENVQNIKDQILQANRHKRDNEGPVLVAFRCPPSSQLITSGKQDEACPALTLDPAAFEGAVDSQWTESSACRAHHKGRLCAVCESGYTVDTSNHECVACPTGNEGDYNYIHHLFKVSKTQLVLILLACFVAVLTILRSQKERLKRTWHLVWTNVRICLGLAQILSLLSNVLDIVYPPQPSTLMHYAALFAADVRGLLLLDCPGRNSQAFDWYGIWVLTTVAVPAVTISLVVVRYCFHRLCRRMEQNQASTNVVQALFIVILLLYPQISAKIMSALRCKELGPGIAVLEADYSIDCTLNNTKYQHYRWVAMMLFFIWPFGIPVGLGALLTRQWIRTGRQWEDMQDERGSDALAATLVATRSERTARAEFSKTRMLDLYDFCVDHYKPEFWWFEPADMLRKLSFTGLLQFAWRGTAAQVLLGCCLSFVSLGAQCFFNPYVEPSSNFLKACAETVLFLTFLIGFVVRVHSPQARMLEPCGSGCNALYGWLLISSYLGFIVLAGAISIVEVRRKRKFQDRLLGSALALPSSWTNPQVRGGARQSLPEIALGALTRGISGQPTTPTSSTGLDVTESAVNSLERENLEDGSMSSNDGSGSPASTRNASDTDDESGFGDSENAGLASGMFTVDGPS